MVKREQKITLGEMRSAGPHRLLVYRAGGRFFGLPPWSSGRSLGWISSQYTPSNVAASSFVGFAIVRCSSISLRIAEMSSSRSKIPFRNNSPTKIFVSENAEKLTASSLMRILIVFLGLFGFERYLLSRIPSGNGVFQTEGDSWQNCFRAAPAGRRGAAARSLNPNLIGNDGVRG